MPPERTRQPRTPSDPDLPGRVREPKQSFPNARSPSLLPWGRPEPSPPSNLNQHLFCTFIWIPDIGPALPPGLPGPPWPARGRPGEGFFSLAHWAAVSQPVFYCLGCHLTFPGVAQDSLLSFQNAMAPKITVGSPVLSMFHLGVHFTLAGPWSRSFISRVVFIDGWLLGGMSHNTNATENSAQIKQFHCVAHNRLVFSVRRDHQSNRVPTMFSPPLSVIRPSRQTT